MAAGCFGHRHVWLFEVTSQARTNLCARPRALVLTELLPLSVTWLRSPASGLGAAWRAGATQQVALRPALMCNLSRTRPTGLFSSPPLSPHPWSCQPPPKDTQTGRGTCRALPLHGHSAPRATGQPGQPLESSNDRPGYASKCSLTREASAHPVQGCGRPRSRRPSTPLPGGGAVPSSRCKIRLL